MVFLPSHQDHWIHVVVFSHSLSLSFSLHLSLSYFLFLSFLLPLPPLCLSFLLSVYISFSLSLSFFLFFSWASVWKWKWGKVDGLLSAGYFYFSFQCYCSDRMISNGFATKQESRTKILLLLKRSLGKYFPDIFWQVLVLWTFICKRKS